MVIRITASQPGNMGKCIHIDIETVTLAINRLLDRIWKRNTAFSLENKGEKGFGVRYPQQIPTGRDLLHNRRHFVHNH
jgi:hypothetical protein